MSFLGLGVRFFDDGCKDSRYDAPHLRLRSKGILARTQLRCDLRIQCPPLKRSMGLIRWCSSFLQILNAKRKIFDNTACPSFFCPHSFAQANLRSSRNKKKTTAISSRLSKIFLRGGKRGIRTPGASQLNGFQDRRTRPLCHLSERKGSTFFSIAKFLSKKIKKVAIFFTYNNFLPQKSAQITTPSSWLAQ